MSDPVNKAEDGLVVVLAPSGRDGEMVRSVLVSGGVRCVLCRDIEAFCAAMPEVDAGIIAEEALTPPAAALLCAKLESQPVWSDFPLIVLGAAQSSAAITLFARLAGIANLTLLERPTRPFTLTSMTRAALRARERQYQTREHLEELTRAREDIAGHLSEIASHRDELEEAVRKRTEELATVSQLLRLSERMASIGTLAAGLGHDLGNLVMPMRVSVLAIERTVPGSVGEELDAIKRSLDYIAKFSASLRLLSLDPDRSDVGDDTVLETWWEYLTPLLKLALPKGVELDATIEPGLAVKLAPHRLTQAVLNLVSNSGDVLKNREGGAVRVSAFRISAEAGAVVGGRTDKTRGHGDGSLVRIVVRDNGPGMTSEVMRRCLEPMFTTGTHSASTGLGLSLVDGIIRAAGGTIDIESELGRGTAITLTLPASRPAPAEGAKPVAVVSIGDARKKSIFSMMLEQHGYEVQADGLVGDHEADSVEDERPVSVWVTEPGEESAMAAERVRRRCPEARIVLWGDETPRWRAMGARAMPSGSPVADFRKMIRV